MNSDDGGRLPKRKGSVSVFSMKRLMHSELLQVVADRERPRSERCYWLPRAADSSSNKQPIIGPESKQSILCCEQSRSEASTIRIPSPSLHLERGPDFRRESSSSSGRLQASRKSSISAEGDQSGPEAGGSTAPSYPKLDTTLPIDSDRRDVNASMEISAVLSSLIIQDLKDQYKQLPILEGFLEKLCPNKSMLKFWQTRFFFIEGDCLCYSREFIEVQNRRHPDYEELIINRIPFLLMLSITGDQDRRQLIIEVHDKKRSGCVRQYVLRAKAADVRDRWLEGIKQYAKHFRDMIQLGNLTPQSFDSKNLDQMGIMPNSISSPATYNSRAQSLP